MKMRIAFFTLIPFMVSGCADFTSIWRIGEVDGVQVASLDAKQRLFIANAQKYCAEPSPDALSAFSSSFGLGVSIPEKAAASLAQGLSEGAGSIGLRTQSIQLLRDMLYRVCEAAHNNYLNDQMVAQLHERYQDTMVAILAIEQLTGAVQAKQVVLGGSSNAAAAAGNLLVSTENLEKAEAYEAKKEKEKTEAEQKLELAKEEETKAGNELTLAKEEQRKIKQCIDLPDGDANRPADCPPRAELPDKQTEASTKVENKNKELDEKKLAREGAEKDLARAERQYKTAQEQRDQLDQLQGQASSQASAATTATGEFENTVTYKPIAKDVAQEVKDAVVKIVDKVIDKDHKVDTCLVLLSSSDRQQALQMKQGRKTSIRNTAQARTPGSPVAFQPEEAKEISDIDASLKNEQDLDQFCQTVIRDSLQSRVPSVIAPDDVVVPATNGNRGTPASHSAIREFLASAKGESKIKDKVVEPLKVTNNAPTQFPVGVTKVTFVASDKTGYRGTAEAAVIVDNEPPVVTAPGDITVAAVNALGTPASHSSLQAFLNGATAKDNVDQSPTVKVESAIPDPFPLGLTRVTFGATDSVGNMTTNTVQATVTVEDQTKPTVTPPADLVIDTAGGTSPALADSRIQDFLHGATAADNVDGRLVPSNNSSKVLSDPVSIGSFMITFGAKDKAGNSGTAKAMIRVK